MVDFQDLKPSFKMVKRGREKFPVFWIFSSSCTDNNLLNFFCHIRCQVVGQLMIVWHICLWSLINYIEEPSVFQNAGRICLFLFYNQGCRKLVPYSYIIKSFSLFCLLLTINTTESCIDFKSEVVIYEQLWMLLRLSSVLFFWQKYLYACIYLYLVITFYYRSRNRLWR